MKRMVTVGELLQQERIKKGLTLEDIEKNTRIRKKNIVDVEANDWREFSSKTYIVGIIRTYGRFLGLNEEKLTAFFRREYERIEDVQFNQGINKKNITPQKKRNFSFLVMIISFLFLLYFGYQVKLYLTPPRVIILDPTITQFTIEDRVQLIGKTEKEALVSVNGNRLYLDKNNVFETTIPLNSQKTQVTIEVTGSNGRKTTIIKNFTKKLSF